MAKIKICNYLCDVLHCESSILFMSSCFRILRHYLGGCGHSKDGQEVAEEAVEGVEHHWIILAPIRQET